MKKCVICGYSVEDGVFYCPQCGEFVSFTERNLIYDSEKDIDNK
jgi:predicted RNA-binding Zn-ribbon protein involved in translation (DUF1610 family)